jgi:hypothetical protein
MFMVIKYATSFSLVALDIEYKTIDVSKSPYNTTAVKQIHQKCE